MDASIDRRGGHGEYYASVPRGLQVVRQPVVFPIQYDMMVGSFCAFTSFFACLKLQPSSCPTAGMVPRVHVFVT